jgi:hypothetical protein
VIGVPVLRPNGKLYRPRKGPVAVLVEGLDYDQCWIYVLRTHDEERARELAQQMETIEPRGRLCWIREAIRNNDREYVEDTVRGMPVVIFQMECG